ncbi:MAG: hypothetical protein KGP28_03690 [Bdellovibrionales bacterium]|nr:hypothetical protein [Bdellovibrionales bacterium]
MLLLEFLNRISFFSVLAWSFFFIAAVCAILLTSLRSPLLRKYRKSLIAVASSSMILGLAIWSLPLFLSRLSPDQSRLTPIEDLVRTEWIEPMSNPETELPDEEISWAKGLGYQFKYKLKLGYDLQRVLTSSPEALVLLDQEGNLHGFHAYTGLNHWVLRLRLNQLLDLSLDGKKLYLLERTSLGVLRISCVDYLNPALLWTRTIPRSREGAMVLDPETQTLFLSGAGAGAWALKSKTGEVLWKRPELFSKVRALRGGKHLLLFEPQVAGRRGHWMFLDPASGKTLQRTPHVYPDVRDFRDPGANRGGHPGHLVIGMVDEENSFLLNPADLSQRWTNHAESSLKSLALIGMDRFITWSEANLLELRGLQDHDLKWQIKVQASDLIWIHPSPDLSRVVIPSEVEGESRSVSFYSLSTGEYLGAARASLPLVDLHFLGDWVYLFSESHVWAYRKL